MTKKRMKAADRRASIIKAATKLFSKKGFRGVSIDNIAQELDVSQAVLYKHFASKQELIIVVLSEMAGQRQSYIEAVIKASDDFRSMLEEMTQLFVSSVEKNPEYLRMEMYGILNVDEVVAKEKKELQEVMREFYESRWKCLTCVIRHNMRKYLGNSAQAGQKIEIACLLFQGMIREALLAKCFYNAPNFQKMSLQKMVKSLIHDFFNAIDYQEQAIQAQEFG